MRPGVFQLCLLVFTLLLSALSLGAPKSPLIDPNSGLVQAPHWKLVLGHCGACHSYKLITAQRGNRDYWLKTIRWMQNTQNLWPIPAEQESAILDYLAEHYDETQWGRRPPLKATLLP